MLECGYATTPLEWPPVTMMDRADRATKVAFLFLLIETIFPQRDFAFLRQLRGSPYFPPGPPGVDPVPSLDRPYPLLLIRGGPEISGSENSEGAQF